MPKTIEIKEARTQYALPLDEAQLAEGPLIVERQGKPIAAIISFAEYERYRDWRERKEKKARHRARLEALERERQAFLRLKPNLLKTNRGLYVAIHDGQVVDSDRDNCELAKRVYAQAYRPVYIELVSEEPETAEFPSPEVVVRYA